MCLDLIGSNENICGKKLCKYQCRPKAKEGSRKYIDETRLRNSHAGKFEVHLFYNTCLWSLLLMGEE
jgi:hypothetical protein